MTTQHSRPLPYGSWPSEISTDLITGSSIRLSSPAADQGTLYWVEGRPQENGRSVLVCRDPDGTTRELTPAPFNVRSLVHEMGGAPFVAASGRCWFVNLKDQHIYETGPGEPQELAGRPDHRFADLQLDVPRERLLAVCEVHVEDEEATNSLVAIDLDSGDLKTLAQGRNFYSNPRVSPDGKRMVWLCWDHPNMPWDNTELWMGEFNSHGELENCQQLAGSAMESIFQPLWAEDGRLFFVSDADDWWNLYCRDENGCRQVTREKAEMGLPQWVFGMSTYGLVDRHTAVASFKGPGENTARTIDLATGTTRNLDIPCSAIEHLAVEDGTLLILGGSTAQANTLYCCKPDGSELETLKQSVATELDDEWISRPRYLEFPTSDGQISRGYHYPPSNPLAHGLDGELPPLIIICHGGPTAGTSTVMDLRIQFWTSRGFAVFDVDYRGSTGYGRPYRRALYGKWGIADVEDCVHASRYLCEEGLADPRRLLIRGNSAGGYLVLCAAAFHRQFTAGASYYGIGELKSLLEQTHKFESRYDHTLLGGSDVNEIIAQRSPARHAEDIRMALILFQGLNDKIVPPEQSENMYNILLKKGLPVSYLSFEGEGHGFRNGQTIATCLKSELAFYGRILGIAVSGELPQVAIQNLPPG